jgi:hypothetical protein
MPVNDAATETQDLRRTLRDLVALSMLAPSWASSSPRQIVDSFVQTLRHLLPLELVYVELRGPAGAETFRVVEGNTCGEQGRRSVRPSAQGPVFVRRDSPASLRRRQPASRRIRLRARSRPGGTRRGVVPP